MPGTEADIVANAVGAAQDLATAFADGDWVTARALSPEPVWTDREYEFQLAGLERATVFAVDHEISRVGVSLWLAQVALESRPTGLQTTLYCVHWRYLPVGTIERIAGIHLMTAPGDNAGAVTGEENLARCIRFDTFPSSSAPVGEAPPTADDGLTTPQQPPADATPDLSGYKLLRYQGTDYICEEAFLGRFFDYDCIRYLGGEPPASFSFPDLRCSQMGIGFECTTDDYYPSELDGYEIGSIDGNRVLCDFLRCWIWESWESPSSATVGVADYECDLTGACEQL